MQNPVQIISVGNVRSEGYEYSFVDQPHDRYMCVICHLPSKDPQMTGECCRGQIFCKPCLDNYTSASGGSQANTCPVCRKEGLVTYPNFQLDREIRSLHVYCINKERGCEWQGEVNNINKHLNFGNSSGDCQFLDVECTYSCGKIIERRYLTAHTGNECPRRQVTCQYCHIVTLEYQHMDLLHTSNCPKFPVPCPNKCNVGTVTREDMDKHRRECQLEVIHCTNKCGSKFERRNLSDHIQKVCLRRKVSCQYCHDTAEYIFINGKHKEDCPKLPLPCPNKCGFVPREDLKVHKKSCPLEVIECEYKTVGCRVKITRKEQLKHKKHCVDDHLMLATCKLNKLDNIQQELNDAKVELASANDTLKNTRDELTGTKHELTFTKFELANTKDGVSNLQGSLKDTNDNLDKTNHELTNTKVALKTTNTKLSNLQGSLNDARSKLDRTSHELTGTKVELTKTKDEVARLQDSLDDTRDKLDKTKHELTDTKLELKTTKDEVANLNGLLTTTRVKSDKTSQELADTKTELKNTKDQLACLKDSLGDARGKLEDTKRELSVTRFELRNTKGEVAKLEHSLNDTKHQFAIASTQINNLMVLLHSQMKPIMHTGAADIVLEAKPSVRLNAMATVFKFGDYVCPVVLKMSDFKKKQKDNDQWYSDPFFTHTRGYKMRLSVVAGETYLSLHLFLMRGPYDDTLKWPLKETFEIKLMNQIIGDDHHSKLITFEAANNGVSRGKGDTKFISNKDLCVTTPKCQFIKDNSMFFKVTKL